MAASTGQRAGLAGPHDRAGGSGRHAAFNSRRRRGRRPRLDAVDPQRALVWSGLAGRCELPDEAGLPAADPGQGPAGGGVLRVDPIVGHIVGAEHSLANRARLPDVVEVVAVTLDLADPGVVLAPGRYSAGGGDPESTHADGHQGKASQQSRPQHKDSFRCAAARFLRHGRPQQVVPNQWRAAPRINRSPRTNLPDERVGASIQLRMMKKASKTTMLAWSPVAGGSTDVPARTACRRRWARLGIGCSRWAPN